jgi:hypothetical protein
VIVFELNVKTTVTNVTVKILFFTSTSTDFTFFTVKNLLFISVSIVKTTDFAIIFRKFLVAIYTLLTVRLNRITNGTFYSFYRIPVEFMAFLNLISEFLIVANSTRVKCSFSADFIIWAFKQNSSRVVRALPEFSTFLTSPQFCVFVYPVVLVTVRSETLALFLNFKTCLYALVIVQFFLHLSNHLFALTFFYGLKTALM